MALLTLRNALPTSQGREHECGASATIVRRTSLQSLNRQYLSEADQLRGLAALLVFWYHSTHSARNALGGSGWPQASNPLSAILWEGHTGVSLFFVLSGFILTYGTFEKHIDYWEFIRNRALRIMPLSILVLMFSIYGSTGIDFGQIAASFLLLKNTSAAFSDPAQISGTLWTVAAEFQIYLIAPFLIAFMAAKGITRYALPTISIIWLLRLMILAGASPDSDEMVRISYFTAAARANQFIIGVAIAVLLHRGVFQRPKIRWVMLAAGLAGITLFSYTLNRDGGINQWSHWRIILPELEGLLWGCFLIGFLGAKPLGSGLVARATTKLGLLSFSIYILHYPVQFLLWTKLHPLALSNWVNSPLAAFLLNAVLLTFCICLSAMTWSCIEKPFLALRRSYLSDKKKNHGAA